MFSSLKLCTTYLWDYLLLIPGNMKSYSILHIILFVFSTTVIGQINSQWQSIESGSPSARMNHTMVTIDGLVYLFGGENTSPSEYYNDLWVYEDEASEWSELAPSGDIPTARAWHTATVYNGNMYVFGGATTSGTVMDIWEYNPQTNGWTKKASTSEPSARLYHRATSGENKMWITGGMQDATSQATGELWSYDITTNTWEQHTSCPAPRYGHVAYYFDGSIFITCGRNGNEVLNDRWKYNISTDTWESVPASRLLSKVKFPAFTYNNLILWIAGGTTIDGFGNFEDVPFCWQLNFALNLWVQLTDGPVFSFGAASMLPSSGKSTDSDYRVLLFGGSNNGNVLDDTWIFSSSSGWNLVNIQENNKPVDRQIKVFPTITSDFVTVESDQIIETISIFDLQGNIILNQELNNTRLRLDLSEQSPGTYIIVTHSKNGRWSGTVTLTN